MRKRLLRHVKEHLPAEDAFTLAVILGCYQAGITIEELPSPWKHDMVRLHRRLQRIFEAQVSIGSTSEVEDE